MDALVREAAAAGHAQQAVVGTPADDPAPDVGGLAADAVTSVRFAAPGCATAADLPFPVPGMSDVMPYPSSVWSRLDAGQLAAYRRVWRERLAAAVARFRPDIIHTHHVWLMSSLLKDVAPQVPVALTCHSTGLRQMTLTPGLADEVRRGCRRIERFCVLRDDHGDAIRDALGVGPARIVRVGAGYRDDLFHAVGRPRELPPHLVYVGKLAEAKGLPWLLDACTPLAAEAPGFTLHVAGDGAGPEADHLRRRLAALPWVAHHGQLDQAALAGLMRGCRVAVLPSFYEGVPLVLVEAAACGCRVVATDLPGVVERLAPALGARLSLVPLPRLVGVDRPAPADLPAFTARLRDALAAALAAAPDGTADLGPFTWRAVYGRVAAVWRDLAGPGHD
ncbi:glycosyltransferase family 4 protein [bacterium]|nr:glycosyltransferase family 4 protein [bacterium]